MKLIVVGPTGQLGSELVRLASARHFAVETIDRSDLDLDELDAIAPAMAGRRADVVVNCTAYNDTSGAEANPGQAFRVNAQAVERLAAAVRGLDARFVHVSTDYVFDGRADRPYGVDAPPAPLGVYGASKLVGEALARRAQPDTLIVRTAALFGVAGLRTGNFVETILRAARRENELRVVDDITVSPTSASDLARGVLAMIDGGAPAGLYHLANRGTATWYEFAAAILEEAAIEVALLPRSAADQPSAVRRPLYSVLDPSRAESYTGRMPHWREALRRYLQQRSQPPSDPGSRTDTDPQPTPT